jgi:hypothetical protein
MAFGMREKDREIQNLKDRIAEQRPRTQLQLSPKAVYWQNSLLLGEGQSFFY